MSRTLIPVKSPMIQATTPDVNLSNSGGLLAFDWPGAVVPNFDRMQDITSLYSLSGELATNLFTPSSVVCVTASVVVTIPRGDLIAGRGLHVTHPDYLAPGLYFRNGDTITALDVVPNGIPFAGFGDPFQFGMGGTTAFLPSGATAVSVFFSLGLSSVTFSPLALPQASWEGTVAYFAGFSGG